MRTCASCGKSIEHRHGNAKRCEPCQKERVRERDRKRQLDPEFRAAESERKRERYWNNPEHRAAERERNRENIRKRRLDPEFRGAENERNRNRIRKLRVDPEVRATENERSR